MIGCVWNSIGSLAFILRQNYIPGFKSLIIVNNGASYERKGYIGTVGLNVRNFPFYLLILLNLNSLFQNTLLNPSS